MCLTLPAARSMQSHVDPCRAPALHHAPPISARVLARSHTDPSPNHYTNKCDGDADSPMAPHATYASAHWFRFGGEAGSRMLSRPPGSTQWCGTLYPGWLATPLGPRGWAPREAKVCFQYAAHLPCNGAISIQTCTCSYDGGATESDSDQVGQTRDQIHLGRCPQRLWCSSFPPVLPTLRNAVHLG